MAKKRGEGSNLGLIITLVFFVLTTVILGVTTYMGYSDQETKAKEKDDAVKAKGVADNDAKYYRMQVRVLRAYMGKPAAGIDAAEVARDKKQFDDGQYPAAAQQKDKEEVAKTFKDLNTIMPWEAGKDTAPSTTYEARIVALSGEIEKGKATLKNVEAAVKRAEEDKKTLEEGKDKEIAALKVALDDVKKKAGADRQTDLNEIASKQTIADGQGKQRADLARQKDDIGRNVAALNGQIKVLQAKLTKATADAREFREKNDVLDTKLKALYEKTGYDSNSIDAAALDTKAREVLNAWTKNWQVIDLGRRGEMPFVSLGSADGLTPQVTFSIHSVGPNGKLNPVPKGTIEIVRVMGLHQAQGRVTWTRDARKDPILKGDRLFNPTWDPNRKRRVAIAGIADLGGDGADNSEDFRRLLNRQKVTLDAYIDTKDEKTPKLVGNLSVNTDYLIIGEGYDASRLGRKEDKEYSSRFSTLSNGLKAKATTNGVPVISLRRYLDMIGYQPPKVISSGTGR